MGETGIATKEDQTMDCVYSVSNVSKNNWATSTNYSTEVEALRLMKTIIDGKCRDTYAVRPRPYGSLGDGRD